jgi:hypothetical protein
VACLSSPPQKERVIIVDRLLLAGKPQTNISTRQQDQKRVGKSTTNPKRKRVYRTRKIAFNTYRNLDLLGFSTLFEHEQEIVHFVRMSVFLHRNDEPMILMGFFGPNKN